MTWDDLGEYQRIIWDEILRWISEKTALLKLIRLYEAQDV